MKNRLIDIAGASLILAYGAYIVYLYLCEFGVLPFPSWLN
ncbi:hypothetical protein HDF11_005202 [Tunturiibacter psychrotolerans]